MKYLKSLSLLLICFLSLSLSQAEAQKYGYLNSMNLLQEMPETKIADDKLLKIQDELKVEGEKMAQAFQVKYEQYAKEVQSGTFSKVELQQKEAVLTQERDAIAKFEQESVAGIQAKRQEFLDPILKKVDKAIKDVGTENGYSMIFDESVGSILFNLESDDVTALVKAKLGI